MSLTEYRIGADVDVSFTSPFAERILALLEHFAGRVLIVSGRRSYAEQQRLYDAYLAGGTLAARPGTSNHERGAAADLRIVDAALSWRTVHAEAEIRGVVFPVPGEDWHAEADPTWTPPPPEVSDVQWRILAPAGSAAKFIAPMAPLPDGTLAALYCVWLPTGDRVQEYVRRGVTELALGVDDLRNVPLVGPVPHGDVFVWSTANFLAAS